MDRIVKDGDIGSIGFSSFSVERYLFVSVIRRVIMYWVYLGYVL